MRLEAELKVENKNEISMYNNCILMELGELWCMLFN